MDQEPDNFAARGEAQNLAARTKPTARGEAQNPDASVWVSPEHAVQDRIIGLLRERLGYEDTRLNLREIIVREMVANLLIHREFTSLGKSEFVIERERMYTSNPCKPIRDGRITPENVHPWAKNPLIAGFFREIGRADRLGSGIRNLYKYCRSYGGGDPVFTEGNEFVISVPLHKLDSVRFSFEKPSIADEKPSIGGGKPSIASEKPSIRHVLSGLKLSRPTHDNILVLYGALSVGEVFGRSRVMALTNLTNGPAGNLINVMLRNKLLVTVVGQGKGKYRFRMFDEEDSDHAH